MRPTTLLLALLLCAPIALATASVHERNVAHLQALVGGVDPATPATMPDGRVVRLDAALSEAAARAGSADLSALATGAAEGQPLAYVGDVWVIEIGDGECAVTSTGLPFPSAMIMPQLGWYGGEASLMSTAHGYTTQIIGWSMKESYFGTNTAGFSVVGNTDGYCFHFGGLHMAFPFVDGIVTMN